MFRKMKLKPYLLMVFALVILLAGIVTSVGVFGLLSTSHNTDKLVNEIIAADTAVKNCRIYVNVAAKDLREMVIVEDTTTRNTLKSEIDSCLSQIDEQIAIFKQAYGEADGLAAKYEKAFDAWFEIADRAVAEIEAGHIDDAIDIIKNECTPALNELVGIAQDIDDTTNIAKQEHEQYTMTMLAIFIACLVGVFAVAFIMAVVIALRTTSSISQAVELARGAVNDLAKGNLKSRIDYQANNEFGELCERMNFSFDEMSKYMDAIDYGMSEFSKGNFACSCPITFLGDFVNIQIAIEKFQAKIIQTLKDMDQSASQVSIGASQVAQGSQALAQVATEQASGVEELSSSIMDIRSHITETSDYAQKVNNLGKGTGEVVARGQAELKQLVGSIRDITEASKSIQSIIKVIDDIAFQTNILAINAAVEASRAGTAGKGFAVVASEVRSLAQKSASAAKDTAELIENTLRHVTRGEKNAAQTESAFNEVSESVHDILKMIDKVAYAAGDQATTISQISMGIDQISAVVQTTSATSEESAAASQVLDQQASFMRDLLRQFKLSNDVSEKGYGMDNVDLDLDMNYSIEAEKQEKREAEGGANMSAPATSNFDKY